MSPSITVYAKQECNRMLTLKQEVRGRYIYRAERELTKKEIQ